MGSGEGEDCAGSSPLTRGKLARPVAPRGYPGLIPAHAGKTCAPSCATWLPRAHPRSRGENAGNRTRGADVPAHPRSRGENTARTRPLVLTIGSSPLTRGKHVALGAALPVTRLIPAHTGKTRRSRGGASGHAAHPRSRGENAWVVGGFSVAGGSSPLTRGKRSPLPRPLRRLRLIPAHAGKTSPSAARSPKPRAHPRSRGENIQSEMRNPRVWGSSPLTRGKRRGGPP